MRTRAAILREAGKPWEVTELDLDEPRPGEVRIRFAAAGLCHSDHHIRTGDSVCRLPMVGGHEGAGVVEAVGAGVTRVQAGDHVVCSFIPACGTCRYCATGRQNLCDMGAQMQTGTLARTGALIHETTSGCLVLCPEHAHLFARAGWSRRDVRQFVYEHAGRSRAELAAVGKDAVSGSTRWRLPADHPEAVPDRHTEEGREGPVHVLTSPDALLIVVAGANNAGVSAVVETFGPRGGRPPVTRIDTGPDPGGQER